jgi:hypothetical protein
LRKIVEADDLHIAPFREDGVTPGTPIWIWSVAVDGDLYVGGYNGQASRIPGRTPSEGWQITAAGATRDVLFEPVEGTINDRVNEALQGEVSRQPVPRPDGRRSRSQRDHQNYAARRRGRRSPPMSRKPTSEARVRITIGDKSIEATLADSDAARDFASLLPLTLAMNDLFRREKFAPLPRAISEQGKRTHDYAVGTIGYWPPGPDVAIFYRQDWERIPEPGLIVLGKINAGVEALNVAGAIRATIELS